MKSLSIFCVLLSLIISVQLTAQEESAIIDFESTEKGILIPRMTTSQRMSIDSPAIGLMVFDLDMERFCFYTSGDWEVVGGKNSPFQGVDSLITVDADHLSPEASNFLLGATSIEYDSGQKNARRMFYHAETGALRFGTDSSYAWNVDSLGVNSFASGSNNMVSGMNSVGLGWNNRVVGDLSMSAGFGNVVLGNAMAVIGYGNYVPAPEGVVLGEGNEVYANGSLVVGNGNLILNKNSLVFGNLNTMNGRQCYAIGNSNQPGEKFSLTIGTGNQTNANYAIAMGVNSIANGTQSLTYGHHCQSDGYQSQAFGSYTVASALRETVLGAYNTIDSNAYGNSWIDSDRLFTIGNGQSMSRSDAMVILKNGNVGIGDSKPETTLHIDGQITYRDGQESEGKILVSDSLGRANWVDPTVPAIIMDGDGDTYITVDDGMDNDIVQIVDDGQNRFQFDDGRINVYATGRSTFLGLRAGQDDNLSNNDNTFIGFDAGRENTTGSKNSAIGSYSFKSNVTGFLNTAVGFESMRDNDVGDRNSAFGAYALSSNETGEGNTGIGQSASANNENGNENVSVGIWSNFWNVHGSHNTAIGARALDFGSDSVRANTALGFLAGYGNSGHRNVFLGSQAGSGNSASDRLYIDNTSTSDPLIYGEFDNDKVKINGDLEVTGTIQGDHSDGVPIGTIQMWPTASPPEGYLICDGDTFDSGMYPQLLAILGSNDLPDFVGRFALGAGNNGTTGSSNHALGSTGGTEKYQLSISEMPSHNHGAGTLSTSSLYLTDEVLTGDHAKRDGSDAKLWETDEITGSTGSKGGNQAHQNMPPFYTINFIIKAE